MSAVDTRTPDEERYTEHLTPDASRPHPTAAKTAAARSGAIGWGIALVGLGILWILVQVGVSVAWEIALPVGIILVGLALLLGVRGGARAGLVGMGLVLTVSALVVTTMPTVVFSVENRDVSVDTVADIEPYEQGAGQLHLDLRDLDMPVGRTPVEARLGFGELVVIVPPDVTIVGDAGVRAGEITAFGRSTAGFTPGLKIEEVGGDTERILELDLEVGFGRIEIRR